MTVATTDSGGLSAREVRERQTSIAYAAITSALAFVVFGPVLYYMFQHWGAVEDYSHGFLVGPLAIYFAWERRDDLRRAPIRPSWWGLLPLTLGLLALMTGRLGVELTAMRVAFVLTIIGLQLLLQLVHGGKAVEQAMTPVGVPPVRTPVLGGLQQQLLGRQRRDVGVQLS